LNSATYFHLQNKIFNWPLQYFSWSVLLKIVFINSRWIQPKTFTTVDYMQKWLISRIKCLQQLNDNIKTMHTHGDKQYTQNLFNITSNIISYRITWQATYSKRWEVLQRTIINAFNAQDFDFFCWLLLQYSSNVIKWMNSTDSKTSTWNISTGIEQISDILTSETGREEQTLISELFTSSASSNATRYERSRHD